MFPVTVKFTRTLKAIIVADNLTNTLKYIEATITDKKADKVTRDDRSVNYKGSTSNSRTALFGIEDGSFTISNDNGQSYLIYEIRMYQLFIFTSIASVVLSILTREIWTGIGAFAWLCGMNWLVIMIRHGSFASELAAGIDNFHGISVEERDDKGEPVKDEKLKSWM